MFASFGALEASFKREFIIANCLKLFYSYADDLFIEICNGEFFYICRPIMLYLWLVRHKMSLLFSIQKKT